MAINLPTELLRSFVAIIDTGSMIQATEKVFVTQSALSLQMRRLEDIVRQPLFNRQGRKLSLTPVGEQLLRTARQILALNDQLLAALEGQALSGSVRVGMNQDFAEVFLPGVLNEFIISHPEIQMQVRVGGSQELLDLLQAGQLDVVLCVRPDGEAKNVKTVPMAWFGYSHLLERDVLPLALLEPPCMFRAAALQRLEAVGRPFRIVVETASLSGIRAAVQAGLAVTCRSPLFLHTASVPVLGEAGLPELPRNGYAVFTTNAPSPAVQRLNDLIRSAVVSLD
jgi:DNA-binding transcriptional LysR family regulator